MTRKFGLIPIISLLSSGAAIAAPLPMDLLHTVQNCAHSGHQKTWCDVSDVAASVQASGVEQRIIDQLSRTAANPAKSRIFISEFSFSDKPVQKKLCELGKLGVPIEATIDYGSSADSLFASSADCQKNPSNPNLKISLLGGFTNYPDWRLHHNKTIIVDAGDGTPFDIAFSSGNLSTFGTSLHMENWVFTKAPAGSNLARATLCLFSGLSSASLKATALGMYKNGADFSKDPQVMKTYQSARDACYTANKVIPMSDPEKAVAAEGIAPFFTPNAGQQALVTLEKEFNQVIPQHSAAKPAYIYIAIEHFSLYEIAQILNDAGQKGVDVRIIMNAGTVSGGSEVSEDGPFYEGNLKNANLKVRFIDTNAEAHQQMHNKFAILNGQRIFTGAGHYTYTGLDSNFETLYLIQNEKLTREYAQYFKELWDESVDEEYITKGTPTTAPAALSPEFLKLLP